MKSNIYSFLQTFVWLARNDLLYSHEYANNIKLSVVTTT